MQTEEPDDAPPLVKAFLRPGPEPARRDTDAFARSVMARVRRECPAEAAGPWYAAGPRWLVPALSLGLAAVAVMAVLLPVSELSATESLLMSDGEPTHLVPVLARSEQSAVDSMLAMALWED
ncbi:MAG: hypothetical protein WC881_09340 [Elusimicrobiota bacterium]|jgi:hypothetical protein